MFLVVFLELIGKFLGFLKITFKLMELGINVPTSDSSMGDIIF